jgi:putative addiction module killer protein
LIGSIARIKIGVQVRSQLWKYNKSEIRRYITPDGRNPFAEWLSSLRDLSAVVKIEQRLDRVRLGNLGNSKSVGEGVCELKIDFGPGYRVYFGQVGSTIVLILCGGDKSTQEQDIRKAKEYWKEYGERENANER